MAKRIVYKGKMLGLSVHDITIEGRRVRREIIEHGGAAAILAFNEDGRVLMVRQHRYPHGYVLEIPAGTMERGESPKECAVRELLEETGHRAGRMSRLISYYPSIGYSKEIIHCYVAPRALKVSEIDADNDEFITLKTMRLEDVIGMILSGKIQDSKTICAIMSYVTRENRAHSRG